MSASYQQANVKRQKVRDVRVVEPTDCLQGIDKIEYNNMASPADSLRYKYYNQSERINGRSMEDWMKISISYTAFKHNGSDIYGKPIPRRNWDDNTNSIDNCKQQLKNFFEFCQKLGVKLWTAFDTDLVPYCENLDEMKNFLEEIVEFIQECSQKYHMKMLWIAPDLHSHSRYASGAASNPEAATFATAASQVKILLELAQRLNAENVLFWPFREGYFEQYKTDINREIELVAKFYKMSSEHKERVCYRGSFLILPGYNELLENGTRLYENMGGFKRYIYDAMSCLCFLKTYNLDRFFKLCVLPGYELNMAHIYNSLGGIQINRFSDVRTFTEMMKCIVNQGTSIPAGINLHIYPRRDSFDLRDFMSHYVRIIDNIARGLRTASSIVSDQIFHKYVQQRYVSYYSGFGARLLNGDVTVEDCEEYARKSGQHSESQPSRSEHWETVFQRYIENSDHI